MTSCTQCKNSGYCPLWKSEKVSIRERIENTALFSPCLKLAETLHKGIGLANNCEKFLGVTR